jgi:hypothetical protein
MRMGPGKHLQGRKLMGGLVKPEEFDYFHEVFSYSYTTHPLQHLHISQFIITQEVSRASLRGYGDGALIYFTLAMTRTH